MNGDHRLATVALAVALSGLGGGSLVGSALAGMRGITHGVGVVGTRNVGTQGVGAGGTRRVGTHGVGAVGTRNVGAQGVDAVGIRNVGAQGVGAGGTRRVGTHGVGAVGTRGVRTGVIGTVGERAAGAVGTGVKLRVAFTPNVPGARTTVKLSLRLRALPGHAPVPLRQFALRLPAGMGIATTTLGEANCEPSALLARGLAGCPGNALLGTGSATGVLPAGGGLIGEQAALYPLMGPPAENRIEVLFYLEARSPVFAQEVLPATFTEGSPAFGEQLQATVPLIETWPEGPDLALQELSSTLGPLNLTYHRRVGSREVSFRPRGIRIPRSCPAHGYRFAAVLGFADGTTATASYSVPCARH